MGKITLKPQPETNATVTLTRSVTEFNRMTDAHQKPTKLQRYFSEILPNQ
jgi:hypothetical protein